MTTKEKNILIVKKFIRFLKDKNALKSYLENIKKTTDTYNKWKGKNRLNHFMLFPAYFKVTFRKIEIQPLSFEKDRIARRFIDSAFYWHNTKEGYYYWEELHSEWLWCIARYIAQIKAY